MFGFNLRSELTNSEVAPVRIEHSDIGQQAQAGGSLAYIETTDASSGKSTAPLAEQHLTALIWQLHTSQLIV